jgi:HAD superfamily hydrolase (TIGR01509 family)
MAIKNIIFDLGGILINLDFDKTINEFDRLGFKEMEKFFGLGKAADFVEDYEVGKINDEQFIHAVRSLTNIEANDEQIVYAWNALLLDFPEERIGLLQQLAKKYRLFLFSNTNALHLAHFGALFQQQFGFSLNSLFEKAYYSHTINQRKPYTEAFEWILNDAKIDAAETLFIDDALNNIEGARMVGLHTRYVPKGQTIMEINWEALEP